MDATVAEVNADENIIVLCPNCHWEFDHGIIDVSDIKRIPNPQMLLFWSTPDYLCRVLHVLTDVFATAMAASHLAPRCGTSRRFPASDSGW
jgi:hypothetical protein